MRAHSSPQRSNAPNTVPDLSERRQASWLQSDYSETVWTVSDTRNKDRTNKIDFNYLLADGRLLVDADRLYSTVKEYAWWVRDPRFSGIDDSLTHVIMVRNLLHLSHALSLRNIWSFAYLQPYDVEQLVEECRYGADAVLRASERVEAHLTALASADAVDPKPFGGLPEYVDPSSGKRSNRVHVKKVLAACSLPEKNAKVLPRVSVLITRAAVANGLHPSSGKPPGELKALPNLTTQALQRWLDPLEQLHAMRRWINAEAIRFKPFPRGAARVAAVKGIGTSRTPTPPPSLVLHLLEHSVRWMIENREKVASKSANRSQAMLMATACWIIIAAFSARRDREIDDLRVDCLRGDKETGFWLQIYIEKTLQRKEWVPVPALVAMAVEILKSLSEAAVRKSGTDHLFQWMNSHGKVTRFDVGRHLNDFAAAVDVPFHRSRDGVEVAWHWHPHQFRRFFAILYFYRFEGAKLEALSHHLRHFSLEMTKRYVTRDPEVASLWTDVEWGYTGHFARSIVAGQRSISGVRGELLKKTAQRLIDQFRRKLQVTSVDRVGASLALVMQKRGLVLTPKPWVTCSCPSTRAAAVQASCRRQRRGDDPKAVGPDFAQAGPSVCVSCPHAVVEGARQAFVHAEVEHLEAATASKSRKGTMFGIFEEVRVAELRHAWQIKYLAASPVLRAAKDEEEG